MINKCLKKRFPLLSQNLAYPISTTLFRQKLTSMFQDQKFLTQISQQTRIYTQYFSPRHIKQFFKNQNIQRYIRYIDREERLNNNNLKNSHSSLKQIFAIFPYYKKYMPILNCYFDWLMNEKLKKESNQYYKNKSMMEMLDMRSPQNWFDIHKGRVFIYHHGPTNSGKTSSAIKQLKQLSKDKKGVYMAPLRLLAWEMQQKLQNCNLITGQDKQYRMSNLTSCTIQAVNSAQDYDVAIIDEIQMIGDHERGWSWTKALLSTKAKRIHLCGDQRALGLVSKLIKITNATLQQKRYSRLGKLKLLKRPYQISNIQQGDCLIQFSVETLHKLRNKIKVVLDSRQKENINGKSQNFNNSTQDVKSKIAMVYGRLPPECRKQQARKFNENLSPYLVATNAIGMGLNLNIKKIVFAAIKRRNSKGQEVELEQHEIQQIAGRAGRGLNQGLVQCSSYDIYKKVRKALKNVNKTYGINLVDDQSIENEKNKNLISENASQQSDQNNEPYQQDLKIKESKQKQNNQFLKRPLTQKQKSIQKAGIFIQYIFIKRLSVFLSQHYHQNKKINLSKCLQLYMSLAQQQQRNYFISQKKSLLQVIKQTQKIFNFQKRDIFQVAKCLSMNNNYKFTKQQSLQFLKSFEKGKTVRIPLRGIKKVCRMKAANTFKKLDLLQSVYALIETYIFFWNKYQFIFKDIQQARRIKDQITELIKQVLERQDGSKESMQGKVSSNNSLQLINKDESYEDEIQVQKAVQLAEQTIDLQKLHN